MVKVPDHCAEGSQTKLSAKVKSYVGTRIIQSQFSRKITILKKPKNQRLELEFLKVNGRTQGVVLDGSLLNFEVGIRNTTKTSQKFKITHVAFVDRDLGQLILEKPISQQAMTPLEPGQLNTISIEENLQMQSFQLNSSSPEKTLTILVKWEVEDQENTIGEEGHSFISVNPQVTIRGFSHKGRLLGAFGLNEILEVTFDLVNPSKIDLGPGTIWIESIVGGNQIEYQGPRSFADLFPQNKVIIHAPPFHIKTEHASTEGIQVTFRWRTFYGYEGQIIFNSKDHVL
jgi:hypothetical protein